MNRYASYLMKLWRPSLEKPSELIKLSHNEPPFGPIERLRSYPNAYFLYQKLSDFLGVKTNNLLLTVGSEQAIRFIFEAFLDYGAAVVYPYPTFGIIDVFAYYRKAKKILLQYDEKRHINFYKQLPKRGSLLYLANPDNPTGASYALEEIIYILEHFKGMVLLDEAYWGYYEVPTLELINEYKNLIITRSFSKAFGIPGARVGFAISNEENIEVLRKLKPINELPTDSINAALFALDRQYIKKNKKQVIKWKEIFKKANFKYFEYLETEGNFILLKSKLSKLTYKKLLEKGIETRIDFPYPLKRHLRISVGINKYMKIVLKTIQKIDRLYSKRFESVHHKERSVALDVSP